MGPGVRRDDGRGAGSSEQNRSRKSLPPETKHLCASATTREHTFLPPFTSPASAGDVKNRNRYLPETRRAVSTRTVVTGTSPLNDPRTVAVGDTGASRIVTIVSIPSTTRPNAA